MARLVGLTLALAATLAVGAPLAVAQQNEVTAADVVSALEGAYGVHPGERRNHTKGTCALGTFVGMPDAAGYSRSPLFSGSPVPVVARFSLLEQALINRTGQGPVRWDMLLTIGEPGDPEDDPTIAWSQDRKELKAGTLTISSAVAQQGGGCEKINYDPLVMGDGIAPTNDPVLLFRSPSYGLSFTKRLQAGSGEQIIPLSDSCGNPPLEAPSMRAPAS